MKNQPLVSIILGNYNYERFLNQSIDSVLNQTYTNFELIVVDDGSTDNSREVIESYHDRLIAIFQKNSGAGSAFSNGVAHSKGEIVCFLDADDYFYPEKLAKVVTAFLEHPKWIQIGHGWTSVNVEGKSIGRNTSNILSQGDVSKLLLKWGKYASTITSGLACRRSALDQVMPINGALGIDSYLNVALPFYGEVGSINEPLMFYRIHGKNMRAHNDDLSYLMLEREEMAHFLNKRAEMAEVIERFDLQRDIDYRSYQILRQGHASLSDVSQIVQLSLQESFELKRSPRDTLIRLIYRSLIAFFPKRGKHILRLGFRGYVTALLKGQQLADAVNS